jgi:UV DNA damage endonuclease
MNSRYGYACINETLKPQNIRPNREIRKKTFESYTSLDPVRELSYLNLKGTLDIIKWNYKNNIFVYRMSSNMFPWMSRYEIKELFADKQWKNKMDQVISEINNLSKDVRLSFHPGAFISLSSKNDQVIQNSIQDLNKHAEIMDILGLPKTYWSKINIHIGGAYGEKQEALKRFKQNFDKLSDSTKSRLTVENDDKPSLYTTEDLYNADLPCPIVFDLHHEQLNPSANFSINEAFQRAISTWPNNIRPVIHYSQSRKLLEDNTARAVAHSDWYYEPCGFEHEEIDIMLESKKKELALKKLLTLVQ